MCVWEGRGFKSFEEYTPLDVWCNVWHDMSRYFVMTSWYRGMVLWQDVLVCYGLPMSVVWHGWMWYYFLYVCLCVCVSVSLCMCVYVCVRKCSLKKVSHNSDRYVWYKEMCVMEFPPLALPEWECYRVYLSSSVNMAALFCYSHIVHIFSFDWP